MKRLTRVERAARAIYHSDVKWVAKTFDTPAIAKHTWNRNADQEARDRCLRRAKAALGVKV